jgi:hypothetical protein
MVRSIQVKIAELLNTGVVEINMDNGIIVFRAEIF